MFNLTLKIQSRAVVFNPRSSWEPPMRDKEWESEMRIFKIQPGYFKTKPPELDIIGIYLE